MRKMSKFVKIFMTTILTLSMILGSYMGVFASPYGNVSETSKTMEVGDVTNLYMDLIFDGNIATNIAWNSSDPLVATVENKNFDYSEWAYKGEVTAVGRGSTDITIDYDVYHYGITGYVKIWGVSIPKFGWINDGHFTETCTVTVSEYYEDLHLDISKTGTINFIKYLDGVADPTIPYNTAEVYDITVSLNGIPQTVDSLYSDTFARVSDISLWETDILEVKANLKTEIEGEEVVREYSAVFDSFDEFEALKAACLEDPQGFDILNPTATLPYEKSFCSVIFDPKNGEPTITKTVESGFNLPDEDFPDDPSKGDEERTDGKYYFEFEGWMVGDEPANFVEIMETLSVIASYSEHKYIEVKFYVVLADGTRVLADTQYLKPGESAVDPAEELMKKNGYVLGVWSGNFENLEEDTDVVARASKILGDTDTRDPNVQGNTEVRTGDNTPIVSMSILLIASAFSIVFITTRRRKNA